MLFGWNYKTQLCFTCPTTIPRAEPLRFELGKGWVPADGQRPSGDSKMLILPPTLWEKLPWKDRGKNRRAICITLLNILDI